jgi:hypothetical protein
LPFVFAVGSANFGVVRRRRCDGLAIEQEKYGGARNDRSGTTPPSCAIGKMRGSMSRPQAIYKEISQRMGPALSPLLLHCLGSWHVAVLHKSGRS